MMLIMNMLRENSPWIIETYQTDKCTDDKFQDRMRVVNCVGIQISDILDRR